MGQNNYWTKSFCSGQSVSPITLAAKLGKPTKKDNQKRQNIGNVISFMILTKMINLTNATFVISSAYITKAYLQQHSES